MVAKTQTYIKNIERQFQEHSSHIPQQHDNDQILASPIDQSEIHVSLTTAAPIEASAGPDSFAVSAQFDFTDANAEIQNSPCSMISEISSSSSNTYSIPENINLN